MMAPDKIYIQELSDGTWDDCFVYESSETDTKGMKRVPYIRKDTLLEWARIEENKCISNSSWQRFNALQDMIDKLNEM